jgi:hypothetical protein
MARYLLNKRGCHRRFESSQAASIAGAREYERRNK